MSKKEEYAEQVRLLIRLLPIIDEEDCFALKAVRLLICFIEICQGFP